MFGYALSTGAKELLIPGKHRVVGTSGTVYAAGGGEIIAIDLDAWKQKEPVNERKVRGKNGARQLFADIRTPEGCIKWRADSPGKVYCLVISGDTLLAGGEKHITAFSLSNGKQIWQEKRSKSTRAMAVADGRLVVSADKGVQCLEYKAKTMRMMFAGGKRFSIVTIGKRLDREIFEQTGKTEGYACVVGDWASLADKLARDTEKLHVISLVRADEDQIADERKDYLQWKLNGARVAVLQMKDPTRLPFASYFADLVVLPAGNKDVAIEELYRILHPSGGVLYLEEPTQDQQDRLKGLLADSDQLKSIGPRTMILTRGKLPGSGQWQYPFATGGKTLSSDETRIKMPLELLWFGGPGPARMVDRHMDQVSPLSVAGRVFVAGSRDLVAFDAYNGRELWNRPFETPSRSAPCVDERYLYVTNNADCHVIDQLNGQTVQVHKLPASEGAEWIFHSVMGNLLLGASNNVLGQETRNKRTAVLSGLFALDKETGVLQWQYKPKRSIPLESIAFGDGRIFLVDSDPVSWPMAIQAANKNKKLEISRTLIALDADTGKVQWREHELPDAIVHTKGKFGGPRTFRSKKKPTGYNPYSNYLVYAKDTVVMGGSAAYDAKNGSKLWERPMYLDASPVVNGDYVIVQEQTYNMKFKEFHKQPVAYHIRTGEPRMTEDILTKESRPWRFVRSFGCGSIAGSQDMLFFRSSTIGFYDFAAQGTSNWGSVRPGCKQNMVAADGLVIAPETSSGCACAYHYQTSLAFAPTRKKNNFWYIFEGRSGQENPVGSFGVNFGAPGDRYDTNGVGWLGFPRPNMLQRGSYPLSVKLEMDEPRWYQSSLSDRNHAYGWVVASGLEGAGKIEIKLPGSHSQSTCIVKLYFAEPTHTQAPGRVFDVKLQGKPVLKDFVLADTSRSQAGEGIVIKEFKDILVNESLCIELLLHPDAGRLPIISGVEILK